jgi:hypothetical protein
MGDGDDRHLQQGVAEKAGRCLRRNRQVGLAGEQRLGRTAKHRFDHRDTRARALGAEARQAIEQ